MKRFIALLSLICASTAIFASCSANNTSLPEQSTEQTSTTDNNTSDKTTDETTNNENSVVNQMKITVGDYTFIAQLEDNQTAQELVKLLPLTLNMSAMSHEKYFNLSTNLPTDTKNVGNIQAGDIMLWGSNCLVLFYESFSTSYSYTRIGKVNDTTNLATALGQGSVTITWAL